MGELSSQAGSEAGQKIRKSKKRANIGDESGTGKKTGTKN
jgi:hypothetical protein